MSIFIHDIRYGLRALLGQKGFATIAVLTLAIGIGANTAIFSLLNPLIFRPLPVPDAERLCRVFSGQSGGNIYGRMSYPNYTDLRTSLHAFESLAAASWPVPFSMGLGTGQGGPSQTEVVWGAVVSGNYFTTLGVHTALGRAFLPEEDSVPDARPVVVVSHRLWETKLAADPRIIGYTLRLNSREFTISFIGGLCGLAVASAATRGLLALTPPLPIEIAVDASIDVRVLLFTLAVSVGTGLLLGILPTIRSVKQDLTSALKHGDAGTRRTHTRMLARDVLVVGQIAVSLVLLITAGLCMRSLQQAEHINVGFDPENRLLATIDVGRDGYTEEQGVTFQSRLLQEARAIPGIVAASFTAHPQLGPGYLGDGRLYVEGEASMPDDRRPVVYYDKVAPRYFEAMGTPLLSGRDFTEQDRVGMRPVGIVNETLARSIGLGESPVGKRLRLSNTTNASWIEIVGVVADAKYQSLGEPSQRHLYLPSLQSFHSAMTLVLRTSGDPRSYMQTLQSLVQKLDPDLPVTDLRTMNEHLGFALYPARVTALLFTISGVLGLLLAMIGVYGLLTFIVRQRTREVGIRVALGARSQDVVWLVARNVIVLLACGVGLGLLAAYAVTGMMASLLYGLDGRDPLTFAVAPLFLLLTAVVATAVPARQASRVDPIVALRAE